MKTLSLLLLCLGICAGAFGAHALKDLIAPERLEAFKTGSNYQIIMSLTLFSLSRELKVKSWTLKLLSFGIMIFSFSLYLLVLLDLSILGALTPIGGLCIILAIAFAAFQVKGE